MGSWGKIGDYVSAVGAKTLSRVDIDPAASHGHEFGSNGAGLLQKILGKEDRRESEGRGIPALCIYLCDGDEPCSAEFRASWYDARRNDPNRSSEWRLYYKSCEPISRARPGDLAVFGMMGDGRLLILMAARGSSVESRTKWLFGIDAGDTAKIKLYDRTLDELDAFGAQVLALMGIDVTPEDDGLVEQMIARWGYSFPSGKEFARWAEDSLVDIDPARDDPDEVLMAYYEQEYRLFTAFEETVIQHEYDEAPFVHDGKMDVPAFTIFYKHVRNRRVSRAGTSLEQHVERILKARNIEYTAQGRTEGTKKPDFLFPSVEAYHSPEYVSDNLKMLASKTSTKDRWRQVIDEAARIDNKHLLTIAPAGVSKEQNAQMVDAGITLVMPRKVRETHDPEVMKNAITFAEFLDVVAGLHYSIPDGE